MDNIIENKSFAFAIRIIKLYKYLCSKNEFVLSKQLLKSGTSIGANVAEAEQGQSRPEFISKMNIALKEATETKYWLRLLKETEYISQTEFLSIFNDCIELEKILVSIIKSSK